jgi:hypothetical protein
LPTQIVWNWNPVLNATGYKWNITNDYGTATDMGTNTSKTETDLICQTPYTRYVWVYSDCGVSFPTILTQATSGTSLGVPSPGSHQSLSTRITWNWNPAEGATGYRFGISNDFESAVDVGPDFSYTETGLTCNTSYIRYAWAYNICGNSSPAILSQSTSTCWTCGDPLTINHIIGNVAPVTKIVTYGTVTNIPGAESKCWITSNLGANHQATSVNDTTEASAGWYWQFNRMQGYKHTGMSRTPATPWITSIGENTDWISANDPCTIELGIGWRLPTRWEWFYVDNDGGWVNWNDPWNSALKIHAAGHLYVQNGMLWYRGSDGYYWSGSQVGTPGGFYLYLNSGSCYVADHYKAYGMTIRCLQD